MASIFVKGADTGLVLGLGSLERAYHHALRDQATRLPTTGDVETSFLW